MFGAASDRKTLCACQWLDGAVWTIDLAHGEQWTSTPGQARVRHHPPTEWMDPDRREMFSSDKLPDRSSASCILHSTFWLRSRHHRSLRSKGKLLLLPAGLQTQASPAGSIWGSLYISLMERSTIPPHGLFLDKYCTSRDDGFALLTYGFLLCSHFFSTAVS
ncbi:hypothetical protein BS78_05G281000 [Paspalum vaginatum]|nr:hypothetical protein BS78_05G281000 [Paspalum vaginatum]